MATALQAHNGDKVRQGRHKYKAQGQGQGNKVTGTRKGARAQGGKAHTCKGYRQAGTEVPVQLHTKAKKVQDPNQIMVKGTTNGVRKGNKGTTNWE